MTKNRKLTQAGEKGRAMVNTTWQTSGKKPPSGASRAISRPRPKRGACFARALAGAGHRIVPGAAQNKVSQRERGIMKW